MDDFSDLLLVAVPLLVGVDCCCLIFPGLGAVGSGGPLSYTDIICFLLEFKYADTKNKVYMSRHPCYLFNNKACKYMIPESVKYSIMPSKNLIPFMNNTATLFKIGSEVPHRSLPATPRTTKQQRISVPSPATRTPTAKGLKIVDRRPPRSPASEQKKQPGRISDLEYQLAQLQKELKKAHDQLSSSELWKKQAHLDNEAAKKQLASMSAKLEESEQQIQELSASEDSRVQELRKISQDRDRAWQSELDAVRKHHSIDSASLVTAMNDIQKLKMQLGRVAESEAMHSRGAESAHAEVQSLEQELGETLNQVENLKNELTDCKESQTQAMEAIRETKMQLAMAKSTEETLRSEGLKVMEAYNSVAVELEQSKNQIIHLEGLVRKLQAEFSRDSSKNAADPLGNTKAARESDNNAKSLQVEMELKNVNSEMVQLRSALEAAERRYQEEYVQSTLQIRSAYELVEHTKLESCKCEAELEANLMIAKSDFEDLKARLMVKETNFQTISEENRGLYLKVMENQLSERESELKLELRKIEEDVLEYKANLLDKETKLQSTTEANEALKMEMEKRELKNNETNDETFEFAEAGKDAEQEALMKLSCLTEEANKSSRKIDRVTEQLDAAEAANSKMEAELRKLKVQSDQWRKAAETAAAMLTTGDNDKIERTGSLDNKYHTIGRKLSLPFSEDIDDDSPKKKNGNKLKKFGVLLKKSQK
ncbi:interactor of constitutive active ROPs 2, chloroplastic-like [Heracleum sosnowskyi]|uniref:Interactor of constitutive active ROPs 2, chloroplastic-like n=1 Tax=Heracleum sosnowskyi TaxID=360622 RepID=A0AAD8IR90_9APIA|nr:interactor of constitutive active ROPs 2, chloroplastic-like [Heracleum sosnowskyi]